MLALAALAIRLESRGHADLPPARASGCAATPFDVVKLRTMVTGAEHIGAGLAIDEGDARITRVGALLRRTSIDELPNLVNVLRGEMSLVGPRPTLQVQVDRYTDRQRRRLEARPGLTGWAQVNGRASLPWPERIELDIWYLEHAVAAPRPADPRAQRADGRHRPRALPGARPAAGWSRRRRWRRRARVPGAQRLGRTVKQRG